LGSGKYGEIERYVLGLKAGSLRSKDRKEVVSWMRQLVDEFLDSAENGDEERLAKLIAQGVPVNYKRKSTGATALHYIAAYDARPAFRVLIKSKDVDYLARDKQGRLASELAFVGGCDTAMARLLRIKEVKQAQALGIRVTRRPQIQVEV
jgi:ankyrin repeat protein